MLFRKYTNLYSSLYLATLLYTLISSRRVFLWILDFSTKTKFHLQIVLFNSLYSVYLFFLLVLTHYLGFSVGCLIEWWWRTYLSSTQFHVQNCLISAIKYNCHCRRFQRCSLTNSNINSFTLFPMSWELLSFTDVEFFSRFFHYVSC